MELENKFNDSKVYKIVCRVTNLVYIGSTTQGLNRRLIQHKADYKRYLAGNYSYLSSFEIIKNNDYYIKKIKSYNFNNNDDLLDKETFWIKRYGSVNKNIPNRTKEEYSTYYYQKNKDIIVAKHNKYRLENRAEINAKQNISCLCSCGKTYTKQHKHRHEQTKLHLKHLKLLTLI